MSLPSSFIHSNTFYYVITNMEGKIVLSNNYFATTFSKNDLKISEKKFVSIIPATEKPAYLEAIGSCLNTGDPISVILQTISNNGIIPVNWEFSIEIEKISKEKKIITIGYNINNVPTIAKEIVKKETKKDEKYKLLFEEAFDAILVTNSQGNFIDVNSYMCLLFGYSRSELLSMNIRDLIDPEQLKHDPLKIVPVGQQLQRERRMMRKNGSIVEVEIHVKKLYGDETLAIARDITERRKASEQIKKEKDLADSIINSLPGIFYLQDGSGKYLRWNQDLENITGYSQQEVATMNPFLLFDVNEHEDVLKSMNKALSDGFAELEAEIITKSSIRIPHYFVLRSVIYLDQLCLIVTGIDMSEEVKANLQMQVSESTFRGAFEFSSFGMSLVSTDGRWLKVNNELCKLLGYTEEELLNYKVTDITHPDEVEKTLEVMRSFYDGKTESVRFEKRYVHKKGKVIWVNLSTSLIKDSAGTPLYFVSQLEDISGRKEYEEKINEQINLLSEISFITSHELRHEYAKLHAVINFLKDRQDLFTNSEDEFLITESIKAFNNINSSIYKINDKITFGQIMEINLVDDRDTDHEYILLIDDDPIANYVNSKLMEKHFDKDKIFKANSADQGIKHLKKENNVDRYIILLDLNMPKQNGWDFLDEYRSLGFTSPIIILTSSINIIDREKARQYSVVKKFMSKPLNDESAMQIKKMK